MASEISLELIVPQSRRTARLRDIEDAGGLVQISDQPFRSDEEAAEYGHAFEPLIVIVSIVSFTHVVRMLQRIWQDATRPGGQVIDVRYGKCRVREVESL